MSPEPAHAQIPLPGIPNPFDIGPVASGRAGASAAKRRRRTAGTRRPRLLRVAGELEPTTTSATSTMVIASTGKNPWMIAPSCTINIAVLAPAWSTPACDGVSVVISSNLSRFVTSVDAESSPH
jgi:hypothetical protein